MEASQAIGRPERRIAAILVALGAAVLGAGLLLGPTPSADTAQALRDIDGFRDRYILTNAVDLVGILLMGAGLLALARVQLALGGGLPALLGGVANALGGALIAIVVVLQSTVDTGIAARFVDASEAEQTAHLAVAEAALELDGAIFGVGFLFQMLGIALVAVTFMRLTAPRLNRVLLVVGAVLAGTASLMGLGALFDEAFGRLEALLGLVALAWLIVLSGVLWRQPHDGH